MKYIIISLLVLSCSSLQTGKLENGSKISLHKEDSLPRQIVSLRFEGFTTKIPLEDQAAIPVLLQVFDEGPKGMTKETYKQKLFLQNASISFSPSYRSLSLNVMSPPVYVDETLALAFETFRNPKLDKKTVENAINITKQNLLSSFSSMRGVILYHSFKDYFNNHPFTFNGSTSPKNVSALSYEKVMQVYKKYFVLDNMRVYSTGPMKAGDFEKQLNLLIKKFGIPAYEGYNFAQHGQPQPSRKVQVIHRSGVTDHQVMFLFEEAFELDQREGVLAQAMFEYFGGGLTGKLGNTLREQRGLTYHVSSNYGRFLPSWYIYSFAGSKQLEALLKGIIEVKNHTSKALVTQEELDNTIFTLTSDFKQAYELPIDELSLEAYADLFDYNYQYLKAFPKHIRTVSTKELEAFKQKILSEKDVSLYLMGDKNVILPVLNRLGYKNVSVIDEKNL